MSPVLIPYVYLLLIFLMSMPQASLAQTIETETLSDDVDLDISKYPAQGEHLILWIASGYGFRDSHKKLAGLLAQQGLEVWQTDLLESQFLPKGTASIKALDGQIVSRLISKAHEQRNKKITLLSSSYGAIPVLRGIRKWQQRQDTKARVLGSILFSPSLYQGIPPLGTKPNYLPIAYASNSPIYIFQGAAHGNRWQLDKLVETLLSGGSPVYTELLPNIGSIFFRQETDYVKKLFPRMPYRIKTRLKLLESSPFLRTVAKLPSTEAKTHSGLDNTLKKFKGSKTPPPIDLFTINGKPFIKNDFKNQVTIVNFWASWCKPCIEEIPSLNNLRRKMVDKPFELISINYAEKPEIIAEFMKTVKVDFPVLLDPDGLESAKWLVIAFPSTFVIGPDGLFHYGVNAGIQWDSDEVLGKINTLLHQDKH